MIRGKVCRLPEEGTCCLQHNIKVQSAALSILTSKRYPSVAQKEKRTLASSFARSWGSKLQPVRTWRTMEGLADSGNSPGVASPKQWRCCRWNGGGEEVTSAVIGWSGMLWYWIVSVPLVVASMGTAYSLQCPKLSEEKI